MKEFNYLIVGSCVFGSTFPFLAKKVGKRSLVIDKRFHLVGNHTAKKSQESMSTNTDLTSSTHSKSSLGFRRKNCLSKERDFHVNVQFPHLV